MELKPELVDELLKGYQRPEDLIGESGLLKQLTKANRAGAEKRTAAPSWIRKERAEYHALRAELAELAERAAVCCEHSSSSVWTVTGSRRIPRRR